MRKTFVTLVTVAFLCLVAPGGAGAGEEPTRQVLGAVYTTHLQGMKDKNLAVVIDTLHPGSPAFASAKASIAQTMINFDLSYKITDFQLVGVTGDFAVIRVKLETRKVGGAAQFEDNELDSLQIFRRTPEGKWKIWSSSVLQVRPLNPPSGK